jgi:hypothetical protein
LLSQPKHRIIFLLSSYIPQTVHFGNLCPENIVIGVACAYRRGLMMHENSSICCVLSDGWPSARAPKYATERFEVSYIVALADNGRELLSDRTCTSRRNMSRQVWQQTHAIGEPCATIHFASVLFFFLSPTLNCRTDTNHEWRFASLPFKRY